MIKNKNLLKTVFLVMFFVILFSPFLTRGEKIDINSASLNELKKIIGIGEDLAKRIIEGRPFSSLEDLLKIKGIGEKTLEKIKKQGFACANCKKENNEKQPTEGKKEKSYLNIIINEVLPNPEGPDHLNEWVELKNIGENEVDFKSFKLKDLKGKTTEYIFPSNTLISPNGFLVLKRSETNIILNNEEEGLELISPQGDLIDKVIFEKAPLGKSYNRTKENWEWSSNPTPGKENFIENSRALLLNKENSVILESKKENQDKKSNILNPWFLFLSAVSFSLFSGIIVFLANSKLKK